MMLYAVLFEKKTSLRTEGFRELVPSFGTVCQSWLSMGHFDAIHTCVLNRENSNPFQLIQETNAQFAEMDCRERDFHPLYLISRYRDSSFWQKNSFFLVISRIHFGKTTGANKVYERLLQMLWELDPEREIFHLYRTVELCDAVLVGKSDSLLQLLSVSLTLRKYPDIARVYTYCAVNGKDLARGIPAPGDERIPLCTIRFAVSSFSRAQAEITALKEHYALADKQPHLVMGVDDIVASWTDLPTNTLLSLYRSWFTGSKENRLDEAFTSMTTRLGIAAEDTSAWPEFEQDEKLRQHCKELEALCAEVVRIYGQQMPQPTWLHPITELTYSLLRLSQMPVLDEFFYLMFPGVRAFFLRLRNGLLPDHTAFQLFIESWFSTMEQIMRVEGQLTQYPQLRPPVYDIPVAMLEYVLAFLNHAAALLQKNDENKNRITLFPVPGLFQRISATELFPPEDTLPGLVLIQIPLEMLYNSVEMQRTLCHELSHYIGESLRNREERTKQYAKASAVLLADQIFTYNHNSLTSALASELKKHLTGLTSIEGMADAVMSWLHDFRRKDRDLSRIILAVQQVDLKSRRVGDPPLRYLPDILARGQLANETNFTLALRDLSILFRECYADLCMLYLLPLSRMDYIAGLLKDFSLPSKYAERPYEQVAVRVYTVLCADKSFSPGALLPLIDKLIILPSEHKQVADVDCLQMRKELTTLASEMALQRESKAGRRIPLYAVQCLLNYLEKCRLALEASIHTGAHPGEHDDTAALREMYQNVNAPIMDFDAFQRRIEEYRLSS